MAGIIDPKTIAAVQSVGRAVAAGFTMPKMAVGDVADVTDEWQSLIDTYAAKHDGGCPLTVTDLLTGTNVKGTGIVRNAMHASLVRAARKANGADSQYRRVMVELADGAKRIGMTRTA